MSGLRLKGGIYQIQKRCKHLEGGWLRESTKTSCRSEAESYLIRRLAEIEEAAGRVKENVYLFEEAGLRYLEDIAHKPSAEKMAEHLDQLLPFIGNLPLEQVHEGTIKPFVDHELARGLAPKSVNNAIGLASTVLNRAARVWRNDDGTPWLKYAPAKLSKLSTKGKQAKPYPLSWKEQDRLCALLPVHTRDAVLFCVNTGLRDQEICKLRWDWEIYVEDLKQSVFVLPAEITKNNLERVVVLNQTAREVVESRRGIHETHVFSYRDKPIQRLHNSAWKTGWKNAGLPIEKGILKGVHNLRHTFGRRLRASGVSNETRKALLARISHQPPTATAPEHALSGVRAIAVLNGLSSTPARSSVANARDDTLMDALATDTGEKCGLGHADGDITTHYSAAELQELIAAVESILNRNIAQTPTLTIIKRNVEMVCRKNVGILKMG